MERRAQGYFRFEDRALERSHGCRLFGASLGTHHICGTGAPPNLYVGGGIADIFEAGVGEVLCQERSFDSTLEIHLPVTGVDFIEQTKMPGNRFGNRTIGSGGQRDSATFRFFLPEKCEYLLPIGKTGWIEVHAPREIAFERSPSRKQPDGEQQKRDRVSPEEHEDGLPKHVAPDQSAIEIDAQDRRRRLGGFGSCSVPHGMIVA